MHHAGAHALASRVARAGEPADKEKALRALDAIIHKELNQPDVRLLMHDCFHSCIRTSVQLCPPSHGICEMSATQTCET